jgi:hypothetical protein
MSRRSSGRVRTPRDLNPGERTPRRFGDQWSVGITVGELLIDAALLRRAMRLARDVETLPGSDEERRTDRYRKLQVLSSLLSAQMAGTRLIMMIYGDDGADAKLRPTSTCENLIGAMWLQFYEAISRGGSWRICDGCGRLFSPRREKQKYHSPACRNRTNVRRSTAKRSK